MVLHSERWTLTDDFHQPQHSDPPPRLVCLGTPLATCALPTGVFYLLTYLLTPLLKTPIHISKPSHIKPFTCIHYRLKRIILAAPPCRMCMSDVGLCRRLDAGCPGKKPTMPLFPPMIARPDGCDTRRSVLEGAPAWVLLTQVPAVTCSLVSTKPARSASPLSAVPAIRV